MKNKTGNIIFLTIVAIVSLLISYYLLNDFIYPILFTIISVFLAFLVSKKYLRNKELYKKIDSTYDFINLLNIQMLSTKNAYEAYKSIEVYLDDDFANISSDDFLNQLNEIANDYNLNGFKMYINSLNIYDNDGGNFKEIQQIPTSLAQKTKIYYHKMYNNKQIKIIEISSLYVLWLCVLLFLKISIPDFYKLMLSEGTYKLLIFILLILGCVTYFFAIKEFLSNKIRGL